MLVRLYQPSDRGAVHRIAADTAFFGAPVESFLPDRRLFSDFFMAYYTDGEPEHLWVADAGPQVAGYFAGSLGGRKLKVGHARAILRVVSGFASGRYNDPKVALKFASRMVSAARRGEYPSTPSRAEYPAHLHINVDEAFRGQQVGSQLMNAGLAGMTAAGAPGIHLNTTSYNAAAVKMYEKIGFKLLSSRPTHLWEPWLPDVAIKNLVYGKSFQGD
jgi:ribosomal protein S18 acetylase RimI-like enzyme